MTPRLYIENPRTIKNKDIIDFVTEVDQAFIDSMPDTRKFVRLALPGEVDGRLPVLAMRIVFQNDEGALFKGLVWPPWGQYQPQDLTQLCMINNCDFEQLFYKSYKIKMEKDVPYTVEPQIRQLFYSIVDTVVYKNRKQVSGHIWRFIEDLRSLTFACNPIKTTSGHNVMFFNARHVSFERSAEEESGLAQSSQTALRLVI